MSADKLLRRALAALRQQAGGTYRTREDSGLADDIAHYLEAVPVVHGTLCTVRLMKPCGVCGGHEASLQAATCKYACDHCGALSYPDP